MVVPSATAVTTPVLETVATEGLELVQEAMGSEAVATSVSVVPGLITRLVLFSDTPITNYRDVRPFEAYSVHTNSAARIFSVAGIAGGEATGITYGQINNENVQGTEVVRVYSISGSLVKQGPRDEVLRSLPKGLYIIDGKKIIK